MSYSQIMLNTQQVFHGTWQRNWLYSCNTLDISDIDFLPFGKRADRKSHSDATWESFGKATANSSSVEHLCTTYIHTHAIIMSLFFLV